MDILIKNIELPKLTTERVVLILKSDGEVSVFSDTKELVKFTDALIVPPHGRLIDADILRMKYEYGENRKKVDNAPTVLEATE